MKVVGEELECFIILYKDGEKDKIGTLSKIKKEIKEICSVEENVIQASINGNQTVIAYVVKDENESGPDHPTLKCQILDVKAAAQISGIDKKSETQMRVQFLNKTKCDGNDKLLVFAQCDSITSYELLESEETSNFGVPEIRYSVKMHQMLTESFRWCQWDVTGQRLFFVHSKKRSTPSMEGDTSPLMRNDQFTLTAFQFNEEMPHETVLNMPLDVSDYKDTFDPFTIACEDVVVPLRIFDDFLNMIVLMKEVGEIYICYYRFYRTWKANTCKLSCYVTVLHHGCTIRSDINGISEEKAQQFRPVFNLCKGNYLSITSEAYRIYLDAGLDHEPCCHVILFGGDPEHDRVNAYLTPVQGQLSTLIDVKTGEIFNAGANSNEFLKYFLNSDELNANSLSILHYFLVHERNVDLVNQMILRRISNRYLDIELPNVFREYLIANCYRNVCNNLTQEGLALARLLPLTCIHPSCDYALQNDEIEVKINLEMLKNTTVMLLTPRQRLIRFKEDIWNRLWELLQNHIYTSATRTRFKNSSVSEKLIISLQAYQPEALSRCMTPSSPGVVQMMHPGMFADLSSSHRFTKYNDNVLPFEEVETCTASKQEHVISVFIQNLREVSLHLVKSRQNPMQVHSIATKYVASQLEMSRLLCSQLTKAAEIDTTRSLRGFPLINELSTENRKFLYLMMERYCLAVDSLAFPLPQGFSSFFPYLGYKVLPFEKFLDHTRNHVFQINIDVMKALMTELTDGQGNLKEKLNILLHLPRSRVKRILNQWNSGTSLMLRAREHSSNILSGLSITQSRSRNARSITNAHKLKGSTVFSSKGRVSPMDTFLDLLTAKASLAEIDFNLLVDATVASLDTLQGED